MKKIIAILSLMAIPYTAFAGAPQDPCGEPYTIDYVKMVINAGTHGCGKYMSDFPTTGIGASTSYINGLQDPNLIISVLVQDPATGKTLSAVIKCDVSSGKASFLDLHFAAEAYGGCTLPQFLPHGSTN